MSRHATLALLGCLTAAVPAFGHAILLDSTPPARSTVSPGPVTITLHFNARLDHARSRLALVPDSGPQTRLVMDPAADPDAIIARFDAPPGHWALHWQVLALDGHITRGTVPFTTGR